MSLCKSKALQGKRETHWKKDHDHSFTLCPTKVMLRSEKICVEPESSFTCNALGKKGSWLKSSTKRIRNFYHCEDSVSSNMFGLFVLVKVNMLPQAILQSPGEHPRFIKQTLGPSLDSARYVPLFFQNLWWISSIS